ncbi:GTPase [Massilia scottii]|uniref:GTPase n=1 Tax=Massilia scottii TaxID=3057166 RepID=UPI0027964F8C|nr:GTPase [Massilia sp. CCM 9029]MDQ1832817.1 GTPase [Massilia sp. CCM 9029]
MTAAPARRAALTLVTGASAPQREAAIAARLAASSAAGLRAVLLEGLPSGQTLLSPSHDLQVHRIAPGCLCCTGNLVLRVTLNRILRLRPDWLFIGLAATDHLDQLRSWLQDPPYDQLLELTADLHT